MLTESAVGHLQDNILAGNQLLHGVLVGCLATDSSQEIVGHNGLH